MAKHNSLDDINVRGGFQVPVNPRIPRTKAPQEIQKPEIQIPNPIEREKDFESKTKTMTKAGPGRSKSKPKTAVKTKPKKEGQGMRTLTKLYGTTRGFSPTFRGGPSNPDQPGEDAPGVSLPAGEIPYLDGPRVDLPSEKFTGIHELDQLDQTRGSWAGVPSQIRTHIQSWNIQAYPQYGGVIASANGGEAALANVSQTQDQIFMDHYSNIVDYYSRKYTVNKSFEDNFTLNNFYLYLYDNSRVLSELLCLLARAAYYQSEKTNYTENASVEKLANVLNTTNFYPIRNKLARAIKRQYFSKSMMDEIIMFLQTYRLTPHETGGTICNTTFTMYRLISSLAGATNEAGADSAINTYINTLDRWCDYILYGRPQQTDDMDNNDKPRRNVNGTLYPLFNNSTTNSELTVTQRNAIGAVLARVSGDMGPFDYVKCNRIPQGNSQSMYDPAFCDRFNNGLAKSNNDFFPPMLCGTLDADKPELAESVYFASERDDNNQDERTAFHMLNNISGESPIFYDMSRNSYNRAYLIYIGRNNSITSEEKDLTYIEGENLMIVNNSQHPPVQDNYITKLYSSTGSNRYFTTMPDGDASALFFLTYGNMVEQFKKR